MQIREILTLKSADIHSIAPTDSVASAVDRLVGLGVGSLVVLKNGEMVGLLTERDVVKGMLKQGCDLKDAEVSTIMETEPVVASADDSVDYARDVMTKSHIGHLPILEGDKLFGIISFHGQPQGSQVREQSAQALHQALAGIKSAVSGWLRY
jgi:CBS domain-containing protein